MVKNIRKILIFVLIALMSLVAVSCGEEKATFSVPGSLNDGETIVLSVSSSTTNVDLSEYMIVNQKAKVKFYSDEEMDDEIDSTVLLKEGDNVVYVKVKEGLTKKTYKVNILRKQLLTVSFNANGGSGVDPILVDYGFAINAPTTTREGYDFVDWGYDFTLPITSNLELTANWTPKKYSVSSESFETVSFDYNSEYSLPEVSKNGYKFVKWVDANGNDFSATGTWTFTNDVSVTAVFEKETYKITYVYGAGLDNDYGSYTVDDNVTLISPKTIPEGLNFVGWVYNLKDQATVTTISKGTAGDKVLYAKWIADEEVEHTITVDAEGCDFDGDKITVFYGSEYSLPNVTPRKGYSYTWKLGNNVIEPNAMWTIKGDATVKLEWTKLKYSITYVTDDKITNPNSIVEFSVDTETIILAAPTKPNSKFMGWFTTKDFAEGTLIEKIEKGTAENIILYPKFETIYYKLILDSRINITFEPRKYEFGEAYELPILTSAGGTFVGWYTDINDESTRVENSGSWSYDKDITLYAKWNLNQYSVEYTVNGTTTKIDYTMVDTVMLPTPALSGFAFHGWQENGSTGSYQYITLGKGSTGNRSYTAVFSRFEYAYDNVTKTATVSRFVRSPIASVVIPEVVNFNGIDYTVTGIGKDVFKNMGDYLATYTTNFAVEIPKTLKTIGENAFYNCTDVTINIIMDSSMLTEWADSLEVASGNDQVVDVIKGRRPAIGWSVYG